jgi:3-deoxy-D-manno-octulosonate 8-phosphate phosphatase (KDO 8-P phosphatase)
MPDTSTPSPSLLERAKKIRLLLMDIDGTLTDGGVCLISLPNNGGIAEMKVFNSQDGLAIKLAHIMGIQTGFITGRKSPAVQQRAEELSVAYVYLGQATKTAAFEECMQKAGVTAEEVAYLGDDLPDMPVSKLAGLAVAVANAAPELKAICHYVTRANGGEGSAREVVELILKAQGRWEEAIPKALA